VVKNILVVAMFVTILMLALQARAEPLDPNGNSTTVIGSRPPGCPRAYCGCGLRLFLGLTDARLNRASMWRVLFPPTAARPGAVAVRPHHVFLLVAHVRGDVWTVRDYNSGRGLSRIHQRSVRGYVFVKPGVNSVSENMVATTNRSFTPLN
jgi:hypothetical protein